MLTIASKILFLLVFDFFGTQAMSYQWEPQIAVLCETEQSFYPQYFSENGKWVTNFDMKPIKSCLKDKMDLLNYCKQVYPERDITNIVESSHYQKIGGWCSTTSENPKKCRIAPKWIKAFRCLEGPFQSDALLVPEGCLFDHIHNTTRCWPFLKWNQTGALACKERNMQIRSFAMLLPCGISLFSGVEFVCCPKETRIKSLKKELPLTTQPYEVKTSMDKSNESSDDDDYDEYDVDEAYLDDDKDDIRPEDISIENVTKSTEDIKSNAKNSDTNVSKSLILDPYFNSFDPKLEHQNFKDAQQRLEEAHREKVTRVMKNWSDLEEKYQDMRSTNPTEAQQFKEEMTQRFQMSVQTLEEEENAAKHQLSAMHQQRVLERINQRKREAMKCYTRALTEQYPDVQTVKKCLQRLLRALHKDRTHALDHYRHILLSQKRSIESVVPEKALTLSRLTDIDKATNQSMAMLRRFPELSKKLSQLMIDYVQALRSKDDIPGSGLSLTRQAEENILEKYQTDIKQSIVEKERQHETDKKKKISRNEEHLKLEEIKKEPLKLQTPVAEYTVTDIKKIASSSEPTFVTETTKTTSNLLVKQLIEDVAAAVENENAHPKVQHAMKNKLDHMESHFKIREAEETSSKGLLVLSISTLCVVFIFVIIKIKSSFSSTKISEHDQEKIVIASPEEKHLAQMQVNGYENPTYKYFEIRE